MRTENHWQLQTPVNAVIFDCDGTLSAIEGIDELASANQVADRVRSLTADAMGQIGMNPQVYRERLELVTPRQEQLFALGQLYLQHQVPDVNHVIQVLQRLHKTVYIVSAGMNPAVALFGEKLKISRHQIYAVDVQFDDQGNYITFDTTSPLINNDGKRHIVAKLKEKHASIAHIGDGMNDIATYDLVNRFIGYGGVYYREQLASRCDYYIRSHSLAPLLPLLLTQDECLALTSDEQTLYQKGLGLMQEGAIYRQASPGYPQNEAVR
jgi:phosphoserine phosphatase